MPTLPGATCLKMSLYGRVCPFIKVVMAPLITTQVVAAGCCMVGPINNVSPTPSANRGDGDCRRPGAWKIIR